MATVGYGTALGVVRAAVEAGKRVRVIATETRPLLQGARLTVFELSREGIPVTLIADSAVGHVMQRGLVDKAIVGADRILREGVINKVGTYVIASLADAHGVPFYVAAPTSTVDPGARLADVVIEERSPDEVRKVMGVQITLPNIPVLNPAFDFTPMKLVRAVITERGCFKIPSEVERLMEAAGRPEGRHKRNPGL